MSSNGARKATGLAAGSVADADRLARMEGLDDRVVSLRIQREFAAQGHLRIEPLWGDDFADALAADARTAFASAAPPDSGPRTPVTGDRSGLRRVPVAEGPVLRAMHGSLTKLALTLAGRLLTPSFATYGYFERDDGCILHYDGEYSDLTLLIMALGQVAPLRVHPELRDASEADLGRLEDDPEWDRTSGVAVAYPRLGLTAIRGRELPHHRPKGEVDGLAAVAALHYCSVY
jgi:hypothetical protein